MNNLSTADTKAVSKLSKRRQSAGVCIAENPYEVPKLPRTLHVLSPAAGATQTSDCNRT